MCKQREWVIQPDRNIYRQTDRNNKREWLNKDKQTDMQRMKDRGIDRQTEKMSYTTRHTDTNMDRHTDRNNKREWDIKTTKQIESERQTGRVRQTYI